ncbi:hypothetical protein Rhopal_006827-T1 [Rhodotorula paludigena]|uniref:GlcNAc kinase n=1 Tax=Rhodotorula paludigena TaxID=86838 RepID=A0AAV5GX77_9BASI|nr:hypothetical protein Rhopal_006827-T1 [Rhodotorula paludigena]
MRSLAGDAFGFAVDDPALRITNDGHLLAAASLTLPDVETTVALVAGTGSIGLAFRKTADGAELNLIGVSGGWGYLLGDGGSGYDVARIALSRYLADNDARTTASLAQPTAAAAPLPPLYTALLASLGVGNATELIEQVYDSSTLESERKVRLARSAQVVLDYAFPANTADVSTLDQELALSILREAVTPLVQTVMRLLDAGEQLKPDSTLLALGGGMWRSSGYVDLLLRGLAERGLDVPKVRVVDQAAEDGVKALMAMGKSRV